MANPKKGLQRRSKAGTAMFPTTWRRCSSLIGSMIILAVFSCCAPSGLLQTSAAEDNEFTMNQFNMRLTKMNSLMRKSASEWSDEKWGDYAHEKKALLLDVLKKQELAATEVARAVIWLVKKFDPERSCVLEFYDDKVLDIQKRRSENEFPKLEGKKALDQLIARMQSTTEELNIALHAIKKKNWEMKEYFCLPFFNSFCLLDEIAGFSKSMRSYLETELKPSEEASTNDMIKEEKTQATLQEKMLGSSHTNPYKSRSDIEAGRAPFQEEMPRFSFRGPSKRKAESEDKPDNSFTGTASDLQDRNAMLPCTKERLLRW